MKIVRNIREVFNDLAKEGFFAKHMEKISALLYNEKTWSFKE